MADRQSHAAAEDGVAEERAGMTDAEEVVGERPHTTDADADAHAEEAMTEEAMAEEDEETRRRFEQATSPHRNPRPRRHAMVHNRVILQEIRRQLHLQSRVPETLSSVPAAVPAMEEGTPDATTQTS